MLLFNQEYGLTETEKQEEIKDSAFYNVQQVLFVLYLETGNNNNISFPTILSICSATFNSSKYTSLLS